MAGAAGRGWCCGTWPVLYDVAGAVRYGWCCGAWLVLWGVPWAMLLLFGRCQASVVLKVYLIGYLRELRDFSSLNLVKLWLFLNFSVIFFGLGFRVFHGI